MGLTPSSSEGSSGAHGAAVTLTISTSVNDNALIPWNHVNRDTDGYYDATNHQFVVPVGLGGLYIITCQAAFTGAGITSADLVGAISPSFPNLFAAASLDNGGSQWNAVLAAVLELPAGATVEFDLELAVAASALVNKNLSFASLAYLGALT